MYGGYNEQWRLTNGKSYSRDCESFDSFIVAVPQGRKLFLYETKLKGKEITVHRLTWSDPNRMKWEGDSNFHEKWNDKKKQTNKKWMEENEENREKEIVNNHHSKPCLIIMFLLSSSSLIHALERFFDVHNQCKHVTVCGQNILFYVYIVQCTWKDYSTSSTSTNTCQMNICDDERWDDMLE